MPAPPSRARQTRRGAGGVRGPRPLRDRRQPFQAETAPRYIVGVRAWDFAGLDADGRLRALVARGYALETTIGGIVLYRRID